MHVILGHENADFDSVAAMLGAYKLYPDGVPVLPARMNTNVARFIALYRNGLPFLARDDFALPNGGRIEQVTLVDTHRTPQLKGIKAKTPIHIIEHHPLTRDLAPNETFTGEIIGAATTLLVEQIQAQNIILTPLEATLLALGIYEDTGSLVYRTTTPRDIRAAAWLVEQKATLDTVRRFLEPPLNDEQQALLERLVAAAETRTIQGYTVLVGSAKLDEYLAELSSVAHRLRDTLDPHGLFLMVQMPHAEGQTVLHLVCRATDDAIDAGEIARAFGGGGHNRAAAASIYDKTLEETLPLLWSQIESSISPAVRVADLMSYGVQTIQASLPVGEVIRNMRRIGHEGFPVVENGQVVGLLTRRDADRALEHGLGDLAVREIMTSGEITLTPDDPVSVLEAKMVESGWGQIPVVENGDLVGIVTRTDLIKHWARIHPPTPSREKPAASPGLSEVDVGAVLGAPVARLIDLIAAHAHAIDVSLYLVGGVVRDLLLKRRNFDVDFVVEAHNGHRLSAIDFARALVGECGGQVSAFQPFGTAQWKLDETVAARLEASLSDLPDHIDFATTRYEYYEHPTALPTVYSGSIKLDLLRRDFTINTLAVQISPASMRGRILDYYGGLQDLREGVIRVLHSLSFVDDPTRILRAVRFAARLDFEIEARTAELIHTALPMLRRITGSRVRNELALMLHEANPSAGFQKLAALGALEAIHPALKRDGLTFLPHSLEGLLANPPWPLAASVGLDDLHWHVLLGRLPRADLADACERLMMGERLTRSLLQTNAILAAAEKLPTSKPSDADVLLRDADETALLAAWQILKWFPNTEAAAAVIERYAREWRTVRSTTNGRTLQSLGLKPGPCFALILGRVRSARLDGEITDDAGEDTLVKKLLHGGICDGGTG
jgi:tRNA nucleotidyltransferase (CCA-adding enzyme)